MWSAKFSYMSEALSADLDESGCGEERISDNSSERGALMSKTRWIASFHCCNESGENFSYGQLGRLGKICRSMECWTLPEHGMFILIILDLSTAYRAWISPKYHGKVMYGFLLPKNGADEPKVLEDEYHLNDYSEVTALFWQRKCVNEPTICRYFDGF